ncbi:MAG: glycosyltransferase family 4 protein [Acinetobacter sp.]|uniref:glycosyltransferase family 4 protein n=1 Tax=Acinetobacter sp. TaxID=472 RepID=UPI002609E188|nr:glycosyltransferase family 4 protein [Acinetobacter sp.]MDD2945705.1 glycosyltransferase family 4 protein [Acinetobacter sp.]
MNKKKILIVTRNLPPLIGGMERLNWHIADELGHENEILLLSHKDAQNTAPQNCNFYGVRLNPLPLFLITAFIKTFLICVVKKPDILFAGSGLTAPITVFWAKIFRKKSIVYIHGLDINNDSILYRLIWIPFIKQASSIICNSTPTQQLTLNQGVPSNKITIIHPGVNYPAQTRNFALISELTQKYQLENKKILLSIGRLTDRKGLLEFVSFSLPAIISRIPNTVLIIIGDTANNALNKKLQKKEDIILAAEKNNIRDHLIFTGSVHEDNLSSFYYLADAHVFPAKYIPNDPEGFGMVAIEAAAHGKPTVAFAVGGIIDAIKHQESGYLIEKQDYQNMTQIVVQILEDKSLISDKQCMQYAEQFAWYNLKNKFEKVIVNL